MKSSLPSAYVNTPVPVAYADVDGGCPSDSLIVTMIRILGPC